MNVLLAGGAGYIGSHTCVELIEAGHSVIIADNFANSCPEAVRRVEEITGKKIPLYEADVCDSAAVDKIFSENKIDAVIHFAGLKAVGESVEKPLMYYRNNIDSTLTLLEVMKKYRVNNFIFSSSATVYGVPKTVPLVETMLRLDEADDGADTHRHGSRESRNVHCYPPLFQPDRSPQKRKDRRGSQRNTQQPHALYHTSGGGQTALLRSVRRRLSHTRRHRSARLYPRCRPCQGSR